jgi:hypothetical protein
MQTFLPYADFKQSAQCLDRARLGKQRIECKQLINAIQNGGGWANHPAAKMWRGHVFALARYGAEICIEWRNRGYVDNQLDYFHQYASVHKNLLVCKANPPWLGDPKFHESHRSNLLRKDPKHYGKFNWGVSPDLPYIWPET